jgi:hypothetical protein
MSITGEKLVNKIDVLDGYSDVPTADTTDDVVIRDVLGRKTDTANATVGTTSSIMRYTKAILNSENKNKDMFIVGTCEAGSNATTIVCSNLAGYGDDYFNNKWWAQILKNDNSVGNAPEREIREVTDYVTASGTFTVTSFSAAAETDDKFVLLHISLPFTKYQEYLTGSGNWTCPADVFKVSVLMVSGGGGSGGVKDTASTYASSGGGGGGAIAFYTDVPVVPGRVYAYAVGAGGTAGAATPTNGGTGGTTSFGVLSLTGGLGSNGSTDTQSAGGNGAACETQTGGAGGAATGVAGSPGTDAAYGSCGVGIHSGAGGGGSKDGGVTGGIGGATIYASGGASGTNNNGAGGGGASFGAGGNGSTAETGTGSAGAANTGGGAGGSSCWGGAASNVGAVGGSGYLRISWED